MASARMGTTELWVSAPKRIFAQRVDCSSPLELEVGIEAEGKDSEEPSTRLIRQEPNSRVKEPRSKGKGEETGFFIAKRVHEIPKKER